MRLRAAAATFAAFLTATTILAEEYVLTIKGDGAALRSAPSLQVFDKTLKPGDKIVRVFFGGSSFGTECVVAPGGTGELLATKGSAEGYGGEIRLGTGAPPERAVTAEIAPAKLGEPGAAVTGQLGQKAREQALNSIPWGAGLIALALIMVGFFGFRILGSRVGPAAVVGLGSVEKELKALKDQLVTFARGLERPQESSAEGPLGDRLAAIERKLDDRSVEGGGGVPSAELGAIRDLLMAVAEKAERTEAAMEALREATSQRVASQVPEGTDVTGAGAGTSLEALEGLRSALAVASERQGAAFAELDARFNQVAERLSSLEATLAQVQSPSASDEGRVRAALETLGATQATLDALPQTLEALAREVSSIASKTERTEAAVECLSKIAMSGDANRVATPEEAARWEQLLTMEAKLSSVPDAVALLREKIGELESAFAATSQRVEGFQSLVCEIRAEASRENAAILARIEEIKTVSGEADDVKKLMDALAHEFVGFASKVEGLDAFMDGVRQQLEQFEALDAARFAAAESRLAELANALRNSAELRASVEASAAQLSEVGSKVDAVGQALATLDSRLDRLETRPLEEVRGDPRFDEVLAGQRASLEALRTLDGLREAVAAIATKGDSLDARLAELCAAMESAGKGAAESGAVEGRIEEWNALHAHLSEMPQALSSLADSLAALSNRADHLEAGIAELRVAAASPKLPPEAFQPDPRIDELLRTFEAWSALPEAVAAVSMRVEQVFAALAAAQSEILEIRQGVAQASAGGASGYDAGAALSRLEDLHRPLEGMPQALETVQQALGELKDRALKSEQELSELKLALAGASSASRDWDESHWETLIARVASASGSGLPPGTLEKIESLAARMDGEERRWATIQAQFESLASAVEALRDTVASALQAKPATTPADDRAVSRIAPPTGSERSTRGRQSQPAIVDREKGRAIDQKLEEPVAATATPAAEEVEEPSGWEGNEAPSREKRATPWYWTMFGGSAERHWCAESREPVTLDQGGAAPRALTPTEAPESMSPIGQLLFALGHVIYAHGERIRGFWPGKEPRSVGLGGTLPEDEWRMLVHNGQLFCAHEDRVEIVQLGTWSKGGGFKGAYLDQLNAGQHWVGLLASGGHTVVEFRSPSGDKVHGTVNVRVRPEDVRFTTSIGEDVFFATYSGKLYRCNPEAGKAIGQFAETGFDFLQLSAYEGLLVGVIQEGGAIAVRLLDPTGKKVREARLAMSEPFSNAVIMGSLMYVADDEKREIHVLDLDTMEEVDRVPVPGIAQIRRMCGLHDGSRRLLLIAGVDASQQSGKAILFDPESAIESPVCSVGAHSKVHFIPAEGKVVVATSTSYQNIIRVFDPSSVETEGRKAA